MQQEIWGPDGTADLLLLTGAGLLIKDAWLMPDPLAKGANYSTHPGQVTQLVATNVISLCFCSCI
jgi:hypothetical protein